MLKLKTTSQFERDYRKALKSGKDMAKLKAIMVRLARQEKLPPKYRDHKLVGSYERRRECHVQPDRLLIYKTFSDTIVFERTCTHSGLFR